MTWAKSCNKAHSLFSYSKALTLQTEPTPTLYFFSRTYRLDCISSFCASLGIPGHPCHLLPVPPSRPPAPSPPCSSTLMADTISSLSIVHPSQRPAPPPPSQSIPGADSISSLLFSRRQAASSALHLLTLETAPLICGREREVSSSIFHMHLACEHVTSV
jgi:hypothetical protein